MAGITAPISFTQIGEFNNQWISTLQVVMPDIQETLVERYGPSFGWFEMMHLTGAEYAMPNRQHSIFEEDSIERLVMIGTGGIATGAAGASITFTLDSSMYDSMGGSVLQVQDSIVIPQQCINSGAAVIDYEYVIQSISTQAPVANTTYTAVPYYAGTPWVKGIVIGGDSTAATFASAAITTAIPAGTLLMMGKSGFAAETDQPNGTNTNWFKRTYTTGIAKKAWIVGGGADSKTYVRFNVMPNGHVVKEGTAGSYSAWMDLGSKQAEFLLHADINKGLWFGNANENPAATQTAFSGNASPILATTGLLPSLQLLAQKAPYTGNFDTTNLEDIKPLMISQGNVERYMYWLVGDLLYQDAEHACKDYLKEFGSNDSVMRELGEVGLQYRAIQALGTKFIFREISNLSNPNNMGAAIYNAVGSSNYRRMGVMVPRGKNNVRTGSQDGKPESIEYLTYGYKSGGGEDRRRVVKLFGGMTGKNLGQPPVTTYDVDKGEILAEYALITTKLNQFVLQQAS